MMELQWKKVVSMVICRGWAEYALLAYILGVKQMSVACNKMDDKTFNYAESRYKEIKGGIFAYLKKVGCSQAHEDSFHSYLWMEGR
jgi:translation elongation factor EF-1alpha